MSFVDVVISILTDFYVMVFGDQPAIAQLMGYLESFLKFFESVFESIREVFKLIGSYRELFG